MQPIFPSSSGRPPRRLGSALALGLVALAALGQSQCIWGTDEPYLAGEELPPLQLVGADPVDDASGIPRAAPLALRFTHRVRPDSVTGSRVRLLQDGVPVESATRIDLLDCTLEVTPVAPLQAAQEYSLEVDEIRGFGTGPLDDPVQQTYRTGAALGEPGASPPPSFEQVYQGLIAPRCSRCHGDYRPQAGLDLSSVEAARSALRDGVSRQGEGAPFVVPGRHAQSYLMQKMLGLPGVVGEPMPPPATGPMDRACHTPDPALRLIAAWIDGLWPPR